MPFAVSKPTKGSSALKDAIAEFADVEHGEGTVHQMSLYFEARRILAAAYLMFILPDMRDLMRKGEPMQGDPDMLDRVLKCPCTALDVATIFNLNMARIQELVQDEERASMYNDALDLEHPDLKEISLLVMDDENGDEQCVYSLTVNHARKLVSVMFRGSVTTKDFVQDAKALVAYVKNPLPEGPKNLGLHLGFKEYLYEELPWHSLLVPELVKQSFQQFASLTQSGAGAVYGGGIAVGKGVVSLGTGAMAAGTAAGTMAAGAALTGVNVVGSAALTGVNVVGSAAKTGVNVAGSAARSGVGVLTTGVGTVTDFVGVTKNAKTRYSHDRQNKDNNASTDVESAAEIATNEISKEEEKEDNANDINTQKPQEEAAEIIDVEQGGGVEVDTSGEPLAPTTPEQATGDGATPAEMDASSKPEKGKRYEIIMDQVKQVFADYPDYRLYVGGHSLGGALATIFAFECAATGSGITKPVTCITSGAPKVGNIHFFHAFERLERERKLRCIHVANYRDIVTKSPALPMCCCYGNHFRRTGFHLTLSPHAYILTYPPQVNFVTRFLLDVFKWVKHIFFILIFLPLLFFCGCQTKTFLRMEHTQLKYMNRFDNQKKALDEMTLDELYEERYGGAKKYLHAGAVTKTEEDKETTAAIELGHIIERPEDEQ